MSGRSLQLHLGDAVRHPCVPWRPKLANTDQEDNTSLSVLDPVGAAVTCYRKSHEPTHLGRPQCGTTGSSTAASEVWPGPRVSGPQVQREAGEQSLGEAVGSPGA